MILISYPIQLNTPGKVSGMGKLLALLPHSKRLCVSNTIEDTPKVLPLFARQDPTLGCGTTPVRSTSGFTRPECAHSVRSPPASRSSRAAQPPRGAFQILLVLIGKQRLQDDLEMDALFGETLITSGDGVAPCSSTNFGSTSPEKTNL